MLLFTSTLNAQRADRGTVTGLVTDQSGSSVVGATVKIRNDDTGVVTDVKTNESGAYTSPLLILGTYTITVEQSGFKGAVHSGLRLEGGQVSRQDVTLQLGQVSEQVTVAASAEILNTTNADVTHTVNSTFYQNLPVVMGADVRLAESLLQLQPGFTPMKPNGDPMFRGSAFSSRLNGGQTQAAENFFDGVAFGYAAGHNGSHEAGTAVREYR